MRLARRRALAGRLHDRLGQHDLVPSALRQILLFGALGREVPRFGHVPLLLGRDGVRLSKRHEGTAVREMRERGWTPERTVGLLAALLGIRNEPDPVSAADLVHGFSIGEVREAPGGIRIPEL